MYRRSIKFEVWVDPSVDVRMIMTHVVCAMGPNSNLTYDRFYSKFESSRVAFSRIIHTIAEQAEESND